jgi:translation initiation factor 6
MNMKIAKISFYGNPNVGLYAYATDKYCLVGRGVEDKFASEIEKNLCVPVHRINIAGTSLIGALLAGNSKCLLVPKIAFPEEIAELTKLGINCKILESDQTALGNNIACNDKGAIISPEYSKEEQEFIEESLGVQSVKMNIGMVDVTGSTVVVNSKAGLIHIYASDSEKKEAERVLGVSLERTTVNFGNPYLRSGIILNSNGLIMGEPTTTVEVMQIQDAFRE